MTARDAWEAIKETMYQTNCDEYAANAGFDEYDEAVEVIDQLINLTEGE